MAGPRGAGQRTAGRGRNANRGAHAAPPPVAENSQAQQPDEPLAPDDIAERVQRILDDPTREADAWTRPCWRPYRSAARPTSRPSRQRPQRPRPKRLNPLPATTSRKTESTGADPVAEAIEEAANSREQTEDAQAQYSRWSGRQTGGAARETGGRSQGGGGRGRSQSQIRAEEHSWRGSTKSLPAACEQGAEARRRFALSGAMSRCGRRGYFEEPPGGRPGKSIAAGRTGRAANLAQHSTDCAAPDVAARFRSRAGKLPGSDHSPRRSRYRPRPS